MASRQMGSTMVETAADSPEEFGLLAAITRNHQDQLPKLVYADWLEERGDPRGAYLRECVRIAENPRALIALREEFSASWLQIVGLWHRSKIREIINEREFREPFGSQIEQAYLQTARPTLHMLVTQTSDDELPRGCTKFGGCPDLPNGSSWPVLPKERIPAYENPKGSPLQVFCAQIQLNDIRQSLVSLELPADGLLSFFHCGYEGTVILTGDATPERLERCEPPSSGERSQMSILYDDPNFYPLPSGTLHFVEGLELAYRYRLRSLGEDFYNEYDDWLGRDIETLASLPEAFHSFNAPIRHRLLGYCGGSDCIEGPERMPGMRFLATFGSDSDSDHYWGDSGQPFWIIHQDDLAAQRFQAAKCEYGG